MAKNLCDNCGNPVLPTDIVCWHCGRHLEKQTTGVAESTIEHDSEQEKRAEEELEPFPRQTILAYGALTAVTVILLLLAMRSLGRAPIISVDASTQEGGWISVTDQEQRMVVNIPVDWEWSTPDILLSSVPEELNWDTAVAPLGTLVPDAEVILTVENENAQIIVIHSQRLGRLSTQQAIDALKQEEFEGLTIENSQLVGNMAEQPMADFTITHDTENLECKQRFIPVEDAGLVVATCSPQNNVVRYAKLFDTVLNSFQPLMRR